MNRANTTHTEDRNCLFKAAALFLVLGALLLLGFPVTAFAQEALTVYVEGEANAKNLQGKILPLGIGDPLKSGESVITKTTGRADLELPNKSLIQVKPNTVFTLSEVELEGEKQTVLATTVGSVSYRLNKFTGRGPSIRTAGAAAGVRGTEFVVVYEENQLQLFTLSGEVALATEGSEPVLVAAGQKSHLEGGRPTLAEAVAAAEVENLRRDTEGEYQPAAVAMVLAPKAQDSLSEGQEEGIASSESDRQPNQQESNFGADEYDSTLPEKEPGRNTGDNRYLGNSTAVDDITGEFQVGGKWENPTTGTGYDSNLTVRVNLIRK